jgi:hypothetical protein
MPVVNSGVAYYLGSTPVQKLYAGAVQVWPQVPVLTDITPDSMLHLSGAITLTATGANFKSGCVLQLKGTAGWVNIQASTVVSPTQMTGTVDMTPGNYVVRVIDAQGRASGELPFQGQHNTPTLSSIAPTGMYYEDSPQRLTVNGSNFYGAGSGYTGLHLFMLPPGGGWQDKGQMVISSGTSAYLDGIDPPSTGDWKVMVGYDNPNTTRSAQLTLSVTNKPVPTPTVTSADGWQGIWGAGYDGVINVYGTNFVAPMTVEIDNDLCGGGPFSASATVVSPTHCKCDANVSGQNLVHNSSTSSDNSHIVRVTTPNGTSPWSSGQPVGIN